MNWFRIVGILPLLFVAFSKSEDPPSVGYAFSTYGLQKLSMREQKILPILTKYINVASTNLETLKRYQSSLESVYGNYSKNYTGIDLGKINHNQNLTKVRIAEELVKNPIQTFQILERFVWDLPIVLKSLDFKLENETLTKLKRLSNNSLPNDGDVGDAQKSIYRLQETYNLSATDLYSGRLGDYQTYSGLNPRNLFQLGMAASEEGLFTLSFEYFELALQELDPSEKYYKATHRYILEMMNDTAQVHDELLESGLFFAEKNPFHYTKKLENINSDSFRNRVAVNRHEFLRRSDEPAEVENWNNFHQACREWDLRDAVETKELHCEFSLPHPFYTIQPMKFEWLNFDPPVLQIHDFLNEEELKTVRSQAEGFLSRSSVRTPNVKDKIVFGRTSSSMWIADADPSNPCHFLTQKISLATGLSFVTGATEKLQVANYGPGGVYNPHYDAYEYEFGSKDKQSPDYKNLGRFSGEGDRVATFMIYLSNVEAGGGTVFPKLRFAAKPIKRSALFWFNLKKDGELEPKSFHGGCPVLYGAKYIATKWIRSDAQMFIRKCPTSLNDFTLSSQ